MREYVLFKQLEGHKGEARCGCLLGNGLFVTGGFDAACIVWDLEIFSLKREIFGHSDFIYTVCAHPFNVDWFLSSGKDRTILVFDSITGDRVMSLDTASIHQGPICSLATSGTSVVVGSWDGSFSVWSLETGEMQFRSENAGSHAVSVAVWNGFIITGSQDRALKVWSCDTGSLVRSIENAHGDILRSIFVNPNTGTIFTASNDTTVKVWIGTDAKNLACVGTLEGHENFVFSVTAATDIIVSGGEDRTVRLWDLNDLTSGQVVKLPGTVWFVQLVAGRIIAGCSDGVVRVFSALQGEQASAAELEVYAALCVPPKQDKQEVDPATVPLESDMHRWPGKKIGEIKMFKDAQDVVYAYQWTQLRNWEKVGLVTGSAQPAQKKMRKTYGGDQYFASGDYDFIFDVELGDSRMALLPINAEDNPLVAAEKFCARELINKTNISQIVDFIKTNVGSAQSTVQPQAPAPSASQKRQKHFPVSQPFLFRDAKWPQLLSKLIDVNNSLPEDEKLSLVEMSIIESLVAALQQPPSHLSPDFRPIEISLVHTVLPSKFSSESLFVVFDLWRLFVLNGAAMVMYKDSNSGGNFMQTAVDALKKFENNNTGLCAARYLANLFALSVSKWAAVDREADYVAAVAKALTATTVKGTQLACASVMANLANAVTEKKTAKTIELAARLLDTVLKCLEAVGDSGEPDTVYRLLVAVGCCLQLLPAGNRTSKISSVVAAVNVTRTEPVIKECCSDILAAI